MTKLITHQCTSITCQGVSLVPVSTSWFPPVKLGQGLQVASRKWKFEHPQVLQISNLEMLKHFYGNSGNCIFYKKIPSHSCHISKFRYVRAVKESDTIYNWLTFTTPNWNSTWCSNPHGMNLEVRMTALQYHPFQIIMINI